MSYYIAVAGPELTIQIGLASNSQEICLSLPLLLPLLLPLPTSAGIRGGVCHHAWSGSTLIAVPRIKTSAHHKCVTHYCTCDISEHKWNI